MAQHILDSAFLPVVLVTVNSSNLEHEFLQNRTLSRPKQSYTAKNIINN